MANDLIHDVSDTALWVATYRAEESKRADALFKDPLADVLAGDRGRHIAKNMFATRYTAWSVVIRTCIIDDYITEILGKGIDTVVNLGAGLDTRPYRMKLPSDLHWIEVDYPKMIDYKNRELANQKPVCQLERVGLDLADLSARKEFLNQLSANSKKILVLTEGVIPYLTNDQVASLALDLKAQKIIRYWILDYFSMQIMRYLRSKRRKEQMKNAPFQFSPENWTDFFDKNGWQILEKRFMAPESEKRGRRIPVPWWVSLLKPFMDKEKMRQSSNYSGYFLMGPKS